MYRNSWLLALCACALMACDKDKNDEPDTPAGGPTIEDISQLSVGNYWVYERYQFDTLGNETFTGVLDSLAVTGDTVVDGNTFYALEGTHGIATGQHYRTYMRDSADCIIGLGGAVIFSLSAIGEVINVTGGPPGPTVTWSIEPDMVTLTVPEGTWSCYVTQAVASLPGYPTRIQHKHRAAGVGVVQDEGVYFSSGAGFRNKLLRHHVQ